MPYIYEENLPVNHKFKLIISMEVVEHLYSPVKYLKNICNWLDNNGILVLTTPYHGYLKNLVIVLLNRFDNHMNPPWEGGHIKFFSKSKLYSLLVEAGIKPLKFCGSGRLPFLWRSMVVVAQKVG